MSDSRPPHDPTKPGTDRWIDLHTHTTASDGLLSPAALVSLASARGIRVLGVTDHDTLDGLAGAEAAAAQYGVSVVPGVELSTTIPGPEIHILGYFVDRHDDGLRSGLASLARDRVRRIEVVIDKLRAAGIALDAEAIMADASEGSIGRPHVARALIELGVAADMNDAFTRYLKRGTVGWAERSPFTAEAAVSLLREHGAVPVLAHPFSTGDPVAMVSRLAPVGLLGLEVFYGQYDAEQRSQLLGIARTHGLVPTGGSDYHGPRFREGRDLGATVVPEHAWDELQAARDRHGT